MNVEEMVGENVRSAREGAGLTQAELGNRLGNALGAAWTRQAVSAAEKGGRSFTAREIVALAHVLERPAARFLRPPLNAGEVEVSPALSLSRHEIILRTLPATDEQRMFELMLETLRSLAKAATGRAQFEELEAGALAQMFDQLAGAIEARHNDTPQASS